jgi:hypothetical protein
MIIYNITSQVSWSVHDKWKTWLVNSFIPLFMDTGLFSHYQVTRLREVNEEEGPTYAVQLYMPGEHQLLQFREFHAHNFLHTQIEMWGNDLFSFESVMEVIN